MSLFLKVKQASCLCLLLSLCTESALCDVALTTEKQAYVDGVNSEKSLYKQEELKQKQDELTREELLSRCYTALYTEPVVPKKVESFRKEIEKQFEKNWKDASNEVKDLCLLSNPIENQGEIEKLIETQMPKQKDHFYHLMSQYRILFEMQDLSCKDKKSLLAKNSGFFRNAIVSSASLLVTLAVAKVLNLTDIDKLPVLSVGNLAYACFDFLNKYFPVSKTAYAMATTGFFLFNEGQKTNKDFVLAVFKAKATPFLKNKVFLPLFDVCKQKFSSFLPSFDVFDYISSVIENLPRGVRGIFEGFLEKSCAEQWLREISSMASESEKTKALDRYFANFKASQKRIFWGDLVSYFFHSRWIEPFIDVLFEGEVES